jgi:hypothetical protein
VLPTTALAALVRREEVVRTLRVAALSRLAALLVAVAQGRG